jgi:anionic cell wall polymer biosynthesis LytR-Cps2A-Psr (LCP) family protein
VDNAYPLENGGGKVRVVFKKGCQHMDGHEALAYARTRHQDSDYGRMKRQQTVLVALARQVDPIEILGSIPELIEIAGDHLWTTIDPEDLAQLAALAARADTRDVERVTFAPPAYPTHQTTASIKRIRGVVDKVFDDAQVLPEPPAEPPDEGADACQ